MLLLSVECSTPTFNKTEPSGGDKASFRLGYQQNLSHLKEIKLVQQGFELVGSDESCCLWRKPKTFEDVIREREQELSVKSEFSSKKIL
jgi:hypothetical protein